MGQVGFKMCEEILNGIFSTHEKTHIEAALAGVAQWIEHPPWKQRVAHWIPSQDTCLGCGPGPQ